jgi:hypothetical protein
MEAEIVHARRAALQQRDRVGSDTQFPGPGLHLLNELLQVGVERDALHPQDQLVEVLPVLGFDGQAGIDVPVNEIVVEDDDIRDPPVPTVVLKHGVGRPANTLEDNMGWMVTQPVDAAR